MERSGDKLVLNSNDQGDWLVISAISNGIRYLAFSSKYSDRQEEVKDLRERVDSSKTSATDPVVELDASDAELAADSLARSMDLTLDNLEGDIVPDQPVPTAYREIRNFAGSLVS